MSFLSPENLSVLGAPQTVLCQPSAPPCTGETPKNLIGDLGQEDKELPSLAGIHCDVCMEGGTAGAERDNISQSLAFL